MVEQVWYLPRDGYISMPWRNGAGVTHEIMRVPAQGEPFSWRLSLATVASNGPFSAYPGYQRAVALVDGAGFRLDIKNARAQELRARGANGLFAGAAETDCALVNGPCRDLSLMVREPGEIAAVTHLHIRDDVTVTAPPGMLQMLFVLNGQVVCRKLQTSSARTQAPSAAYTLNLHDTLIIQGAQISWSVSEPVRAASEILAMSFAPRASERAIGAADENTVRPAKRVS